MARCFCSSGSVFHVFFSKSPECLLFASTSCFLEAAGCFFPSARELFPSQEVFSQVLTFLWHLAAIAGTAPRCAHPRWDRPPLFWPAEPSTLQHPPLGPTTLLLLCCCHLLVMFAALLLFFFSAFAASFVFLLLFLLLCGCCFCNFGCFAAAIAAVLLLGVSFSGMAFKQSCRGVAKNASRPRGIFSRRRISCLTTKTH